MGVKKNTKDKIILILVILFSIFIMSLNGMNFSAVFIVASTWIIYTSYILKNIAKNNKSRSLKVTSKIYNILVILFVSSFIILESLLVININSFKEPKDIEKVEYVMVLGAGLDGYDVGKVLKSRLDRAIKYYNLNKDTNIIVTGGQGEDEIISEAEAMYRYLVKNGVDEDKIIKEDKATTTLENMVFSKEILEKRNDEDEKVLIVTNEFHLTRSQIIASLLGIENEGLASHTSLGTRVNYLIREYPTMIIDIVRTVYAGYIAG